MKILLGSPARQDERIFEQYIKGLDKLDLPCQVDRFFILNDADNLKPYLKQNEYTEYNTGDHYEKNELSHYWRKPNLDKMPIMRNMLIEKTLSDNYDYLFMVDTDLIIQPQTLNALLEANKDIVAEIFWTKVHPDKDDHRTQVNCWDFGQNDRFEHSKETWKQPGLYRVGGTGACILIHRKVFESGVDYSPIYNLKLIGEDRFFSVRAVCHGFDLWIDTHYPCLHLYREQELLDYLGGITNDSE
jgi:hypothetical protein